MSTGKITWDRIIELVILSAVVIMTGIGVAVRIESNLAVLNRRMDVIERDHDTLKKEFGNAKTRIDELYGMHAPITKDAIPERKYVLKRPN